VTSEGRPPLSGDIENYTGYQFITGPDLAEKFEEHIKKYSIATKENEKAIEVKKINDNVLVKTTKASYESQTVIIASGTRWRNLGIPGEKEFKNRGLTYCATCDGPLFAGRDVAVIGGGNAGLEATIQLAKITGRVYLMDIAKELTGDAVLRDKVTEDDKVTVLTETATLAVLGDKMVTGIRIKEKSGEKTLAVQGVFVEIGLMPNSEFTKGIDKNKKGEIKINTFNETSAPGIFAAGDVTNVPEKQIIVAAGEGAKSSLSAFRYLARRK